MRANGQGFGRRCWPRSTGRLVNAPRHGRAPDERCDCRATTAACEYSKHENWQMIRVESHEIVRPADLEIEPVGCCMRDAREVSSIAKVNGECRTLAVPVAIRISSRRPFCPPGVGTGEHPRREQEGADQRLPTARRAAHPSTVMRGASERVTVTGQAPRGSLVRSRSAESPRDVQQRPTPANAHISVVQVRAAQQTNESQPTEHEKHEPHLTSECAVRLTCMFAGQRAFRPTSGPHSGSSTTSSSHSKSLSTARFALSSACVTRWV